MLLYCEQTHGCTRIHSHTHLHIHAACACTQRMHTPITRTSAPEQHETAPRAASAAAVAAAGCMLACCCCCCCRWHADMLQLLLLLHALERDWPPSHHHSNKHPEQSNPEEHFQRGFLLPVPPPYSLPARATSTASSNFLRAARNVTYILLRASRSQGSPTTDISPGSPESTY